jgi:hypothetical protein
MSEPKIIQSHGALSMACRVEISIRSNAKKLWRLLTDAGDFPRWNSTVARIEGEIREGGRIEVHVPGIARAFAAKISDVLPGERMTWTGGFAPMFKGVRTFELRPRNDGATDFAMEEKFSGLMLPMIKGSLPDFRQVFTRYAQDLKNEAEREGE